MQNFIYPRRKNIINVANMLEKLSTENGYLEECTALLEVYKEQYEMVSVSSKQVIVKMQEQVQELNEMVLKVSAAIPNLTSVMDTSNQPTGERDSQTTTPVLLLLGCIQIPFLMNRTTLFRSQTLLICLKK